MNDRSVERKRVVVLAGAVAAMSAVAPNLMRNHLKLGTAYVCLMVVALIYVIAQFGKAMKGRRSE